MIVSRFAIANGLLLHYLDYGGEGKPWLVCVHGLNGNAHAVILIASVPTLLQKLLS